ncbi:hypothetical protein QE410_001348 [Microbacterium sp. SORGH_AS 1204]|nr:hypothetical protein [Microbacterium sp. SORGH_AS_1204]
MTKARRRHVGRWAPTITAVVVIVGGATGGATMRVAIG